MRTLRPALALLLPLLAALAAPLAAQPAAPRELLARQFQAELAAAERALPGVLAVQVVDLTSGERFGVHETMVMPQGSAIKVAILIELYRQADAGRLRLEERVEVRRAEQVGGAGVLAHFGDGRSALALGDLAVLMIVLSDNTATNLLIERLGMERVNQTLRELGLAQTRLQRKMMHTAESARGRENLSTAAEAADLMARVARCELPLRPESCRAVQAVLRLPKEGSFAAPLPPAVPVAWKPGELTGVRTAWGWVALEGRPYVVAVMTSWAEDAAAEAAVRRVSEASYRYFARLAGATPYGARVPPSLVH